MSDKHLSFYLLGLKSNGYSCSAGLRGKGEFVENGPEVVKYQDKWVSKAEAPPLLGHRSTLGTAYKAVGFCPQYEGTLLATTLNVGFSFRLHERRIRQRQACPALLSPGPTVASWPA